jgi:hypothetical protein
MPSIGRFPTPRGRGTAAGQNTPAGVPLLTFNSTPDDSGGGGANAWEFFLGNWDLEADTYFDSNATDLPASYARLTTPGSNPRISVYMHGSGGSPNGVYAPESGFSYTTGTADAEWANAAWRQWWALDEDGTNYTGRRIVGCIQKVMELHPGIDVLNKGFVMHGPSMGMGGAIAQTMVMPAPWRSRIAYVFGNIGSCLFRLLGTFKYTNYPADDGVGDPFWDQLDFEAKAVSDSIVRGMHYRHRFSSDDGQYDLADGTNTQLPWVNICEEQKISLVATWVQNGHSQTESGVTFPTIFPMQAAEQDVTLDKAHPCFTASTGNYPTTAEDRIDVATYPRGHYNLGLVWDHANIVDSASEIIFPIKYVRATSIGGGIPDQPTDITVSVTPRRPRNFTITNGETIFWSFDSGAQTGSGTVSGDVITAAGIELTSGDAYKNLRFYK